MYSTKEIDASLNSHKNENYRMTHSLSMDDARCNIEKRKNNIFSSVMSMFGSVGNIVSKLPNFMTNINNTLSVTVLPNSTITSEDLLRNLTGSNEHITTDNMYANKSSNFKELLSTDIGSKLLLSQHDHFIDNKIIHTFDWIKEIQHYQQIQQNHQQTNDLNIAIAESLKMDKNYNDNIDKLNLNNIDINDESKMYKDKMKVDEMVIDIDTDVPESQINNDEELLFKKSLIIKSRRKCNVIAKKRKKGKGKLQLRKSGVSQSKHRKERIKHNLYSNIQDDLDTWEGNYIKINNTDKVDDEILQTTGNESDSSYEIIPNYPMFVDTYVLDDSTKIKDCKNKKLDKSETVKMTYEAKSCPEKNNVDTSFVIRERSISNNSTDSDDFSIVFAGGSDGSDCECSTDDEEDDEDEDEDDEDIEFEDEDVEFQDEDYEEFEDEDYNHYEKKEKKSTNNNKVQFNLQPTVHTMIKWNFAYRAARRGPWEEMARDRDRFKGRIHRVGRVLDKVLNTQHRDCIWHERFATE